MYISKLKNKIGVMTFGLRQVFDFVTRFNIENL